MPPNLTVADPLTQRVQYMPGVGPHRAQQLQRLGIETVGDLLFHFPRHYEDLTSVRPLTNLKGNEVQAVQGEVVEIDGRELPDGRTIVSVTITDDGKNVIEAVWFNQAYVAGNLRYGQRVGFTGKVKWYRDHWTISNPRIQYLDETSQPSTPGVVPVYPLTEDLQGEQLRPLIRKALEVAGPSVVDYLPEAQRQQHGFSEIRQAFEEVHFPKTLAQAQAARRRFVYEEFLILQTALSLKRRDLRDRKLAPKLRVTPAIDARIRRLFPFQLTHDQNRAVEDVCKDLASDRPMQRLLQADVGAGKTAVAVYALLTAVANKHQAVLMAPTEVLAKQHHQTLEKYLAESRVRRLLLTGSLKPKARKAALAALKAGDIDLVVGTQALVQEDVEFARLGLVVIDEQHKFGVNQRAQMRKRGVDPHYLVMTATPIPRTVALTVFGDLDCTTIKQLPPGRQPVVTRWLPEIKRESVYDKLRAELRAGRQAFVICPLVEESTNLDVKAAEQTFAELKAEALQEFRLGLLHGRLSDETKDAVMDQFRGRQLDVLVSTVVVEVGVDVPNATFLIVEHADRFGLSQLHQLRGRVSRGSVAGQCYLFTGETSEDAEKRLRVFTRTSDGFRLAEEDAKLRGLGEFFGTRQHGGDGLRFADLAQDTDLLRQARQDAFTIVVADANLRTPENGRLKQAVLDRYGQTLDLSKIG